MISALNICTFLGSIELIPVSWKIEFLLEPVQAGVCSPANGVAVIWIVLINPNPIVVRLCILWLYCNLYINQLSHRDKALSTILHRHPATTQISLRDRAGWSEFTLSACRRFGSSATHVMPCEDGSACADAQTSLSWVHMQSSRKYRARAPIPSSGLHYIGRPFHQIMRRNWYIVSVLCNWRLLFIWVALCENVSYSLLLCGLFYEAICSCVFQSF